jgi:DNA invertase Pin-like site-specific DNA recombinase
MVEIHPEKRLIGYARVSTYGQTLDSQLEQLRAAGCSSRNIYREKVTGARADRRELNRMLGKLAPGDVVTVRRIDRLARSTFDLFAVVKRIADAKAQFRSLAEPWADTGTSTGRLMLAVLGGLADVERDLIRTRTAEGGSRAKARGKHMGRPPFPQHRHSRKRPPDGARRALRCRNWRTATTVAYPPCGAPRGRLTTKVVSSTRTVAKSENPVHWEPLESPYTHAKKRVYKLLAKVRAAIILLSAPWFMKPSHLRPGSDSIYKNLGWSLPFIPGFALCMGRHRILWTQH